MLVEPPHAGWPAPENRKHGAEEEEEEGETALGIEARAAGELFEPSMEVDVGMDICTDGMAELTFDDGGS